MPWLKILPSKEIKRGTKMCKDDQLGKNSQRQGTDKGSIGYQMHRCNCVHEYQCRKLNVLSLVSQTHIKERAVFPKA
jgi:hypothetical protein